MGVPTSEVGYTPAMPRREDHEVHKDMWSIGVGTLILKTDVACMADCVLLLPLSVAHKHWTR